MFYIEPSEDPYYSKSINDSFSFENKVESLNYLPIDEEKYDKIEWIHLSFQNGLIIFPNTFKPEHFNQGRTGLCFLFSSLSSISTIPGLIHQLIKNTDNSGQHSSFTVNFFHNKKKIEISISDNFPFKNNNGQYSWIWSEPAQNKIFAKIIEKAYVKYQLIYGGYKVYNNLYNYYQALLSNINKIIYGGGRTKDAMRILINSEYKEIYNCLGTNSNIINKEKIIFQEIKENLNKNALITLSRKFNLDDKSGHAYSILGAWEETKGNIKKKFVCIKNPWEHGHNDQEKFDFYSLNNSLKGFPELIEFNNKYFFGGSNSYSKYDFIIGNSQITNTSSVFIAPLDFLLENNVVRIDAHIPNYEKDFPSVHLDLKVINILDEFFKIIQGDKVKNMYDSRVNGQLTITRVISVGDKNEREIISNIYNKNFYKVTKNGEDYFELQKGNYDDYNIMNMSKEFCEEYADNLALLTDNLTGNKTIISLNSIINSSKTYYPNHSLTLFTHKITNFPNTNNTETLQNENLFIDTIQSKSLTNFYVNKNKRIDSLNSNRNSNRTYYPNNSLTNLTDEMSNYPKMNTIESTKNIGYSNRTLPKNNINNTKTLHRENSFTNIKQSKTSTNFYPNKKHKKPSNVSKMSGIESRNRINSLNSSINSNKTLYPNHSLTNLTHEISFPKMNTIESTKNIGYSNRTLPKNNNINNTKTFIQRENSFTGTIKSKTSTNFYSKKRHKYGAIYKKIYYKDSYYEGWTFNNKRHGKGRLTYHNGNYKDGIWKNNEFQEGIYYFSNGDYEKGTFEFDTFSYGEKRITYFNSDVYEGGWSQNDKNGYGEEVIKGVRYSGNFVDGVRDGFFTITRPNGKTETVEYEYGEKKSKCPIF